LQAALKLGDWSLLDASKFQPVGFSAQKATSSVNAARRRLGPEKTFEAHLLSCTLSVFDATLSECDAQTGTLQEMNSEDRRFDIGDQVEVRCREFKLARLGTVVGVHVQACAEPAGCPRTPWQMCRTYDVVSWCVGSACVSCYAFKFNLKLCGVLSLHDVFPSGPCGM
jgi:hypothetical protein